MSLELEPIKLALDGSQVLQAGTSVQRERAAGRGSPDEAFKLAGKLPRAKRSASGRLSIGTISSASSMRKWASA